MFCIPSIAATHIIKSHNPPLRSSLLTRTPLRLGCGYDCRPLMIRLLSPIVDSPIIIHSRRCWGMRIVRYHAAIRTEPHRPFMVCCARVISGLVHSDPTAAKLCIFMDIYKGKIHCATLALDRPLSLIHKKYPTHATRTAGHKSSHSQRLYSFEPIGQASHSRCFTITCPVGVSH